MATRRAAKPVRDPRNGPRRRATKTAVAKELGTPFDAFDIDRVKEAISEQQVEGYEENKAFMEGDHWQDGEGYIGPKPLASNPDSTLVLSEIERGFLSKNVIKEIATRYVNGLLGRSPVWNYDTVVIKPADDKEQGDTDKALIAEVETEVVKWWNSQKIHKKLRKAAINMLWAERGVMRGFVPAGKIIQNADGTTGVPKAATLAEALSYVFIDVPLPEDAAVYTDPDSRAELGVYRFNRTGEDGKPVQDETVELSFLLPQASPDQPPMTRIRMMGEVESEVDMELAGNITMHQMEHELYITEQIREQQKALNLALTMIPRNLISSGFLERIFTNVQIPGEFVRDKDGKVIGFNAGKFVVGAGTTNVLRGIEVNQPDGSRTLTNPGVHIKEPSPIKPTIDAVTAVYLVMLEEAKQAHIILSGEALVSGKSREQARSDYDLSLNDSRDTVEMCGTWVLSLALAMAEFFMGQPGKYTSKLRAIFQCHVYTGPVTWEERKQNDASIGTSLSQERAMELNGIVDVDAELARMRNNPATAMKFFKEQGEALKALTDGGVPAEVAAELLGMDPKVVSAIKLLAQTALEQERKSQQDNPSSTGANA